MKAGRARARAEGRALARAAKSARCARRYERGRGSRSQADTVRGGRMQGDRARAARHEAAKGRAAARARGAGRRHGTEEGHVAAGKGDWRRAEGAAQQAQSGEGVGIWCGTGRHGQPTWRQRAQAARVARGQGATFIVMPERTCSITKVLSVFLN